MNGTWQHISEQATETLRPDSIRPVNVRVGRSVHDLNGGVREAGEGNRDFVSADDVILGQFPSLIRLGGRGGNPGVNERLVGAAVVPDETLDAGFRAAAPRAPW